MKNIIYSFIIVYCFFFILGFSYQMEPHAGYNQEDKNIKCTIKSINKYIDNNKISLNFVLLFVISNINGIL